jgi:preprotein translocase subunit SecE
MKKQNQRQKKKGFKKKAPALNRKAADKPSGDAPDKKESAPKQVRKIPKRVTEEKRGSDRSPLRYVSKAGQFLKEARAELHKVKWPTRKELLASTAVVIVLTLVVSLFLGLVDFGLIKIIKTIIG